ncbi:MAG: excinuclease ABC subunit UvrA [Herpetosiphonaceae bacterium]|nr:excinuclease ABC subunit UvrA [Herpetosiphonaceae bacterium]
MRDRQTDNIIVHGAREHNLKNIDVVIPKNQLVVITGLSGSGKSTLAFDTIFAEGQRRYVESLSAYARQFLGQLEKPDVDHIEGLSPAIAIDQKSTTRNPRSTVGTVTEIYDYLRLLFARIGRVHCPVCGREIVQQTPQQITDAILALPAGTRLLILAPIIEDKKGEHQKVLDDARKAGFVRARIDGTVYDLDEVLKLEKGKPHTIEVVVDRLVLHSTEGAAGDDHPDRVRVTDSVETALREGDGRMIAQVIDGSELRFSEHFACPEHGALPFGPLEPRDFSFNNPRGACPTCGGLGVIMEIDPDLVVPDRSLSIHAGAIAPWWRTGRNARRYFEELLASVAGHYHFDLDTPVQNLAPEMLGIILYGSNGDLLPLHYHVNGRTHTVNTPFEGVVPYLHRRLTEAETESATEQATQYMSPQLCQSCKGARLRPELLAVTIRDLNIAAITALAIRPLIAWCTELVIADITTNSSLPALVPSPLMPRERAVALPIMDEVRSRLQFLVDVGLDYLTLDRTAATLSGGEAQRIRLATQIGAGLSGVLYVLDEPSIGLHPRDHDRLLQTLMHLRQLGNSVLVVEHDEATMRAADYLVDIGPGAGQHGGELLATGDLAAIMAAPRSITGAFLSGRRQIPLPKQRRHGNGHELVIEGAREHNLKDVTVHLPLGTLIAVTGVSGSGKSTLVEDILARKLSQIFFRSRLQPGAHTAITGIEHLDKLISIDQAPIGRTPRSNPATYTKIFDPIRQLFAQTPEARARGYDAGRFSFNVKGGRCEACKGEGMIAIEMQFLPDLFVTCDVCNGTRYNRETLDIRYRGQTIADVLTMTVEVAADFFARIPAVVNKLQTLLDVGVGYLQLGQPATTLSGGEAQRIKLAGELARRSTGRTLYILDEPTTGLHFADVERLLQVLQRLVDVGNTVLCIEHNLDVIKNADWIVDLGPDGGAAGGAIIIAGTPETVADCANSATGHYLAPLINKQATPNVL